MKAHLTHLWGLLRHKWFVAVAGARLGVSWWALLIHDASKFTPAEWGGYVRWFTVGDKSPEAKAAFDAAWEHHWMHNPHHWQYWCGGDGRFLMPMPAADAREMVADWCGAGRAYTGRWEVAIWYAQQRDHIILHPDTRALVERLIADWQAPS